MLEEEEEEEEEDEEEEEEGIAAGLADLRSAKFLGDSCVIRRGVMVVACQAPGPYCPASADASLASSGLCSWLTLAAAIHREYRGGGGGEKTKIVYKLLSMRS